MDPVKRKIRHVQRLAEKAQPLKEFGEPGPGLVLRAANEPL